MGKLYDLERRLSKLEKDFEQNKKDFEQHKTVSISQTLPVVSDIEKLPNSEKSKDSQESAWI